MSGVPLPDEWETHPDVFELMHDLKIWAKEQVARAHDLDEKLIPEANRLKHEAGRLVTRKMLELRSEYRAAEGKVPAVDMLERQAVDDNYEAVYEADGAEGAVKGSQHVLRVVSDSMTAYQSILRSIRERT